MSIEITYLDTVWTCANGHTRKVSIDLGDPADLVFLRRAQDELWDGCPELLTNGKRCKLKCKREETERTEWR